jgi:hypothetical protein
MSRTKLSELWENSEWPSLGPVANASHLGVPPRVFRHISFTFHVG